IVRSTTSVANWSAHLPRAPGIPPGPRSCVPVTGASALTISSSPRSLAWMTGTRLLVSVAPNTVTGPPSAGSTASSPEPSSTPAGAAWPYWQSIASDSGEVTCLGAAVAGKEPVWLHDCQPSAYTRARAGSTRTAAICVIIAPPLLSARPRQPADAASRAHGDQVRPGRPAAGSHTRPWPADSAAGTGTPHR